LKRLILCAAVLVLTAAPASAANLIVDSSGTLTGATDVNVGGSLFNVDFLDGTCASVFSGCDQNSDFAFNSGAEGAAAGLALLDQVLIGPFDLNVQGSGAFTRGCGTNITCSIAIPLQINPTPPFIVTQFVTNSSLEANDRNFPGLTNILRDEDFSLNSFNTFARFTRQTAAVPEPSTWATMLIGFGAIGVALRRRRRQQSLLIVG